YSDAWYPQTDGGGFSLVIRDPAGDTSNWSSAGGWRQGFFSAGSPGGDDPLPVISDANGQKITVQFPADVAPPQANALQIPGALAPSSATYDAPTKSATFVLPSILPDANYTATLAINGASFNLDFFVLGADANHDRIVNTLDFVALAQNFA